MLQNIAAGAVSGLFFGAAGTAANRGQALPGLEQSNMEAKPLPLPGVDKNKTAGYNLSSFEKETDDRGEAVERAGTNDAYGDQNRSVLRTDGEGNPGAASSVRKETAEQFETREKAEGKYVAKVGNYYYAYTPVFEDQYTPKAAEVAEQCRRLGLTVVVTDGPASAHVLETGETVHTNPNISIAKKGTGEQRSPGKLRFFQKSGRQGCKPGHTMRERRGRMNRFLSGLGMGMVAGACVGMAAAGMVSDADRRKMKRTAQRALRTVGDAAESMGLMNR